MTSRRIGRFERPGKSRLLATGIGAATLMWIVVANSYEGFTVDSASGVTLPPRPDMAELERSIGEARAMRLELERARAPKQVRRDPFVD